MGWLVTLHNRPMSIKFKTFTSSMHKRFFMLMLVSVGLMGMLLMIGDSSVNAAERSITTIVAEPHITITKPLKRPYYLDFVVNNTGDDDILMDIIPVQGDFDTWKGTVHDRYRSINVTRVRLSPRESNDELSFRFTVPQDVQNGTYSFIFDLASENGILLGKLRYDVTIEKPVVEDLPDLIMEPRYEILDGYRGETFSFQVNLTNTGSENLEFGLSANLPRGWSAKFKPRWENTRIRTIIVDPAIRNTGLEVLVSTPETTDPGLYDIEFILDNEKIGQNTLGVQLNLKGRPVIEVETSGGRLDVDAVAGSQSDFVMIVKNTGSGEAGTVRFLSQAPQYWSIQYDPSQVIDLKPGDQAEVTASIIPPDKTIPGDYYIRSVASTVLGQTELNLRINVARSEAVGVIGILLILAVVGANLALFYRMSTR
tara:strand:- start:8027 stop:9304 length:1278 start_codon:yes stop_codon:yes gene_type:complete